MSDLGGETSILLTRWRSGERSALDRLLADHLDWIRAQVHRRLGPALRHKAETGDYVQQTVVAFLRYGPRFTVSTGVRFRALLAKIAENVLRGDYNRWAAQRRDLYRERPFDANSGLDLDPLAADSDTPSRKVAREEREAWIRLGLELLPPGQRDAVYLRNYTGLSFKEVGERLGSNENAARQRYFRALRSLAAIVAALRRRDVERALAVHDDAAAPQEDAP